jgi:RimJ/RimL family protein N-acetyltransferase
MNLQPTLSNDLVKILPLKESDFDDLYEIASDKLLWEQHPEKDRYKREVFLKLFQEAMLSNTAFSIIDIKTNKTIGSTRFYEYSSVDKSVAIGYTFISRNYWATPYNRALKNVMIDYAFQYVETIVFHVGDTNFRSQKAVEKLSAIHTEIILNRENGKSHFVYKLNQEKWKNK